MHSYLLFMTRKILLSSFFTFFFACIFAAPIGKDKALRIAKDFMSQKGVAIDSKLSIAYSPQAKPLAVQSPTTRAGRQVMSAQKLYYVINNGQDKGYIVIAGDDRVAPILAFSAVGAMTQEAIERHPSIHYMYEEYQRQIQWAIEHMPDKPVLTTRASDYKILIQPLLEYDNDRQTRLPQAISWGQSWPFNQYAPNYNYKGTVYPTVSGCVATGISTVLRWHKWPNHPHGSTNYWWKGRYLMSLNFDGNGAENAAYDWANMPAAVTSGGYNRETGQPLNETQADNIGRLLRDVGYSVQMDYNPAFTGGSGAYVFNAPTALSEHFGYKRSVQFLERSNYTDKDWLSNVYNELKDYGPVVYTGFSQGGGHCFVLDGFASNGFVHVDWGWNRSQNGWHLLNVLKPGQEGIGGGYGGYSSNQQMLRYLEPDGQDVNPNPNPRPNPNPNPQPEKKSNLYIYGNKPHYTISVGESKTVVINVGNNGNDSFVGYLSLSVYKDDNDAYSTLVDEQYTLIGAGYYRPLEFSFKNYNLAPGEYRLAINYKVGNTYKAIQEQAGTITIKEKTPQPKPEPKPEPEPKPQPEPKPEKKTCVLYICGEKPQYTVRDNQRSTIVVHVGNKGNDSYAGYLSLSAYQNDDNKQATILDENYLLVNVGACKDVEFTIAANKLKKGEYKLAVNYKDENGKYKAIPEQAASLKIIGNEPNPNPDITPTPKPKPQPKPEVKPFDMVVALKTFANADEGEHIKIPFSVYNYGERYSGTVKLFAVPQGSKDGNDGVLISSGETTIEKSQRINFTFYTNRTFETLVGSKDGRKYDLLLSFTHNNKDVYAHLGYNNQDYRVGELTITKQEKPQPTPNIMRGDIALNTAYFAQGGLWLGSDNSTISARFTTVKVRYSLYSAHGYNGRIRFYVTQNYNAADNVNNMVIEKDIKAQPGYSYIDLIFNTSNLLPGMAYANIQYQTSDNNHYYYYRPHDQVAFYVRNYRYFDFIDPNDKDALGGFGIYKPFNASTKGGTYQFGDAPQSYIKVQSIGNGSDNQTEDNNLTTIDQLNATNQFCVAQRLVTDNVEITVPANCEMSLFNISGQQIMSAPLRFGNNRISLNNIPCGVYLLKTTFGTAKIIKQ